MKGLIGMFYIIFVLTSFGAIFDNRKFAPIVEILRCLVYLPFDYYLIASVHWHIGANEYLIMSLTVWVVRVVHVVSIIFWVLYLITRFIQNKRDHNSSEYMMASNGEKDVESDTSSMIARNKCQTIFMIFSILLGVMVFLSAWLSRMDSCAQMLNEWKIA
ncbi:unnamed protein product [Oppiella nova]|uniref:Alkylglycerol monooxygenase C-terminal domain-containing protein n=1 Tax=Oppiella nova TaxID=334625 RepID=A0A7R9QQ40_9ACAR|nr:unnamed protein product [Oppiella nova]CAG2171486.1 unnamed protein product [Oppiella nova]